jgi:hypothetical protein
LNHGIEIKFLWQDSDAIEIGISASNGAFSGMAAAYIGTNELDKAASVLEGFPRTVEDTRELSLGTMDPNFAGGGVTLRFFLHGHVRTCGGRDSDQFGRKARDEQVVVSGSIGAFLGIPRRERRG